MKCQNGIKYDTFSVSFLNIENIKSSVPFPRATSTDVKLADQQQTDRRPYDSQERWQGHREQNQHRRS